MFLNSVSCFAEALPLLRTKKTSIQFTFTRYFIPALCARERYSIWLTDLKLFFFLDSFNETARNNKRAL